MEKTRKSLFYNKPLQHGFYFMIIFIIIISSVQLVTLQNSQKWSTVAFKWYIHNNGIIFYKTNNKFEISGEDADIYLSSIKINAEENYARRYLDSMYESMNPYDRVKVHFFGYSAQNLNKLQNYLNEMRSRDAMKSISDGAIAPVWR